MSMKLEVCGRYPSEISLAMGPRDFLDKCHPNCGLGDDPVLWDEMKWKKVNKR